MWRARSVVYKPPLSSYDCSRYSGSVQTSVCMEVVFVVAWSARLSVCFPGQFIVSSESAFGAQVAGGHSPIGRAETRPMAFDASHSEATQAHIAKHTKHVFCFARLGHPW